MPLAATLIGLAPSLLQLIRDGVAAYEASQAHTAEEKAAALSALEAEVADALTRVRDAKARQLPPVLAP